MPANFNGDASISIFGFNVRYLVCVLEQEENLERQQWVELRT